jgi:hypothetical protein
VHKHFLSHNVNIIVEIVEMYFVIVVHQKQRLLQHHQKKHNEFVINVTKT